MLKQIEVGTERISLERPVVMGILNVTPDSFYDGGRYTSESQIINRIHEIVEQGAGIIDVGAYSTRPGAAFVDEQEELSRLSFAVELVRKYYPRVPVSIDTFRKMFRSNPDLAESVVNWYSRYVNRFLFETIHQEFNPSSVKLCNLLYLLATCGSADGKEFKEPVSLELTQEDLADLLGISRVQVTRVLTRLRGRGVLSTARGKLIITDLPALAGLCTNETV